MPTNAKRVEDAPPILNKRAYLFRPATNMAVDRIKLDIRCAVVFDDGALPTDVTDDLPLADRVLLDREALQIVRPEPDRL